jgi:hypothetical protein
VFRSFLVIRIYILSFAKGAEGAKRRVERDLREVEANLTKTMTALEMGENAVERRRNQLAAKRKEAEKIREELVNTDVIHLIQALSPLFPKRGIRELKLPSIHPRIICKNFVLCIFYSRITDVFVVCY